MMRFLLFAACACLYVTPVYATTIQYVGQLAFINNPLGIPDISVGDMYGGQFTYGNSASDVTSPPEFDLNEAFYSFVGSPYSATVSNGVATVTNNKLRMDIENDVMMDAGFASFLTALHGDTFTEGSLFDSWNINAWPDAALIDPPGGDGDPDFYTGGGTFFSIDVTSVDSYLYPGTDFQALPPALGGNNFGRFRLVQRDEAGNPLFDATGSLISLTAVPLPPAVWLFGSGLMGLVGAAKKKYP